MNEIDNEQENSTELSFPLVDSWVDTLTSSELPDIIADLSEVGLDSFIENELFKDVPVLSTVMSVYKIGHTLRERAHMKKISIFLQEIGAGNVSKEEKENYFRRLSKNKQTAKHELEYVLLLLDRLISEQKAKLFAKLYLAYIKEEIGLSLFLQISELLDRFLPGDVECLDQKVLDHTSRNEMENIALQRLQGLGVVIPNAKQSVYDISGNPLSTMPDGTYRLTALGRAISNTLL